MLFHSSGGHIQVYCSIYKANAAFHLEYSMYLEGCERFLMKAKYIDKVFHISAYDKFDVDPERPRIENSFATITYVLHPCYLYILSCLKSYFIFNDIASIAIIHIY